MSPELQIALTAALVGALVGGGFALLGSVLQHFLSLREDRIKRERQAEIGLIDERLKRVDDQIATRMQDILDMEMGLQKAKQILDGPEMQQLDFQLDIDGMFKKEEIERLLKEREELLEERKRT